MLRNALLAGAAGLATTATAADLVGVASFDTVGTQSLYSIDSTTGAATLIGDTGVSGIVGIEWDETSKTLFAYTVTSDLYAISPFSGAATLLGEAPGITPEGDLASLGGTLYATRTGALGVVNGSGVFDAQHALDPMLDFSGLAFDDSGTLWGYASPISGDDELYSIDALTGTAARVGSVGFDAGPVAGLDWDSASATLFLTDGASLYTLDTATAAATLIGAHGFAGFSGLAVIPAPGAGLALVAAGLLAARRRR